MTSTPTARVDPRRRFLQLSRWLDRTWYVDRAAVAVPDDADLIAHYLEHGAPAGIAPNQRLEELHLGRFEDPEASSPFAPPPSELPDNDPQLLLEIELVESSGFFDADFYARQVEAAGVTVRRRKLLQHFCRRGWRDALRPSARFDTWWYWTNYLDPGFEGINPLVHFLLLGQAAGFRARPDPHAARPPAAAPPSATPRRVCLFAGYDAQGLVDDYVVEYVRELSRFADVYYLCDGFLEPDEMAKLQPLTKGAWAVRHAAYDFGSWSMLARTLVGWDVLEQYDELLLVNDSCYLLRPLDDVFATMSERDCDWWGLQATKGLAATAAAPSNSFTEPIPIDEVRDRLLPTYDDDEIYDFHVGSYFLAYRRAVTSDHHFRRLLDSVHRQRSKFSIIAKYEVGLTRFLTGKGYRLDTYVDALYPDQPIFTEWYFELLEQGFPLLKKFLLYRNTYDVPGLVRWKERVLAHVPTAPVDMFERHLLRAVPADELERSFAIERDAQGRVVVPDRFDDKDFRALDERTDTRADWWAFVVSVRDHRLPDNSRAVFEQVRQDPSLTKVVLTRGRKLQLDGVNVQELSLNSPAGAEALARCGTVLVDERPRVSLPRKPLDLAQHHIVVVRGGLTISRVGSASRYRALESRPGRKTVASAVLTTSDVDQVTMLAVHGTTDYPHCRRVGLPALDFLLADHAALPQDLQEAEQRVRRAVGDRRLVLFAPEELHPWNPPYRFDEREQGWLQEWADRHDAVLGLWERVPGYRGSLGEAVLHLSPFEHPSLPVVMRVADALVTDFAGAGLEFLATGRPVVSFVHDLDAVSGHLFYDVTQVMPGPCCRDFAQLQVALDGLFEAPDAGAQRRYERSRRLFHDYLDAGSAARAVAVIRSLRPAVRGVVPT